jgi:hypothetical protein
MRASARLHSFPMTTDPDLVSSVDVSPLLWLLMSMLCPWLPIVDRFVPSHEPGGRWISPGWFGLVVFVR